MVKNSKRILSHTYLLMLTPRNIFRSSKVVNKVSTRLLSSNSPLVISDEVKQALAENKPVVSLESTILTHGFPYPENKSLGKKFEDAVREEGGVPATIAFLKGVPYVGLNELQLQELTENCQKAVKVSRRDIGHVMANKLYGATTIASTSILSSLAGIKVFGTGGLGGVHREGQNTMDISNDLIELGRNPITVVCAGPKSILDIGLTMEYLETQGVYVSTYNDLGESDIEIPGFYARKSGVKLPNSFTDFKEVAEVVRQQQLLGLTSGNLVCIPPPPEYAMDSDFINNIIYEANEEAKSLGIKGKDVTPFLLLKIGEMTKGGSLHANKHFVIHNIKCATKIAKELTTESSDSGMKSITPAPAAFAASTASPVTPASSPVAVKPDHCKSAVIGAVAMDTISKLEPGHHLHDSNPGSTKTSVGGVGHNVALASTYAGGQTVLILAVGDDHMGHTIRNSMNMTNYGIMVKPESRTASYTSVHGADGELLVACADMKIIQEDNSQHIILQLEELRPSTVVLDCNLSVSVMNKVLNFILGRSKVIVEPTSIHKAKNIGELNYSLDLITPTVSELNAIYDTLEQKEKFDDDWFEIIDSLKLDDIQRFILKHKVADLYKQGIIQKCFRLLPFSSNILLKLGKDGVLSIGQTKKSIFNHGKSQIQTDNFYIDYYPIPKENETLDIVNVTGAGDTLLGYLIGNYEYMDKHKLIYNCQLASGLALSYQDAINPMIKEL